MRTILFLLEKEFRQIFRNRAMLPIILVMPVVQLVVLSFAVDYEIKNLNLYIVDMDRSGFSRELTDKFTSSGYFQLSGHGYEMGAALHSIEKLESDLILVVPPDFENDLVREGNSSLQMMADAIDGAKAGLASNYALSIIQSFSKNISIENGMRLNRKVSLEIKRPDIRPNYWFNPHMDYKTYMVPGILVVLVTMIGSFLASMNIVREKELGTIEQINVTPIKKYQFILGKTVPFWIIGLVELSVGLFTGWILFDIPIVGSLWTLYVFAAIYLMLVLGFGLLISAITNTQQQAMFISWFFLVIFILMGGLFTPIENMPAWAQNITLANPIRYFIEVTRAVMLKGSGFADLKDHFIIISAYALAMNILAVIKYRKTVG